MRRFIRTSLELSRSYVTYNYTVHELVPIEEQIPEDIRQWKFVENDETILHPSETLGRQIQMDSDGTWSLFDSELVSVKASWINHRVATFGFVIHQKPLSGRLDVDGLKKLGITPGPIYRKIKNGENVTLEDGQIVRILKLEYIDNRIKI